MPKLISTQLLFAFTLTLGACAKTPGVTADVKLASLSAIQKMHSSGLPSCLECHEQARPTYPVGPNNFDHKLMGASGECASCHVANTSPTLTWKINM